MIEALWNDIEQCGRCKLVAECRKHIPDFVPVHGVGEETAPIMLIGEALGETEAMMGTPFIGLAGQQLDYMLEEAGISRKNECYISNVVKCRPSENWRKNRAPTDQEIIACKGWLKNEIRQLKPKVIVCLGKIPTKVLLGRYLKKTFKLGDVMGSWFQVDYTDSPITSIYHPSYLMQHGKKKVPDCVEWLKTIKRMVDI